MERVVAVLKCFTPDTRELGVSQISRRAGIPKATTHRILVTLTKDGLLERNNKTGNYRIGPELYMLGSIYLSTTDIVSAAKPVTKVLNDLTAETVHVSIFYRGNVLIIMKEESKHTFRVSQHIGTIVPAYASAMGKAFLSELTDAEIDNLIPDEKLKPITSKTIATKTELKRELKQIRNSGIAIDNEGTLEAIIGTGALIRDDTGRAVTAIGIPFPIFRLNKAGSERIQNLVKMGASLISYRLGYQGSGTPIRSLEEIIDYWKGIN
ncbi:MAG: IclR family transcriptional regulator [Dehalococcoidales bacterium]